MECSLPFLDKVWAEQDFEWGSGSWALAHNAMRSTVLDAVHVHLARDCQLRLVKLMFVKVLQAEHPLKLQRFSSLHQLLLAELLPAVVSQALAACKPVLTDMVNSLFNQHCHDMMPSDAFADLDGRIHGYITLQLQACLAHLRNPGMIPSSFTLAEDDSTAAARASLLDKLKKLEAAIHTINRIAGVPEAGSYAFVTSTGSSKQPADTDYTAPEIGSAPFSASGQFSWRWPVPHAKQDTDSHKLVETTVNIKQNTDPLDRPKEAASKNMCEAAADPSWANRKAISAKEKKASMKETRKSIRMERQAHRLAQDLSHDFLLIDSIAAPRSNGLYEAEHSI